MVLFQFLDEERPARRSKSQGVINEQFEVNEIQRLEPSLSLSGNSLAGKEPHITSIGWSGERADFCTTTAILTKLFFFDEL